jgi:imidazolonepropionase-like amidohydrolase
METSIGSLEKGFMADIIGVKGDPVKDITLLQNISFVMKAGKIYKQTK